MGFHWVKQEEQMAIRKGKKEGESLTWEDTKKMPLTYRVIQETMRVASILSFTFREAVEDVEYEGMYKYTYFKSYLDQNVTI